ncbi:MAG: hypothetical protein JWP81_1486 [Ferruginibacter sp.]|nr:hypothetical protein [Ferruginibacter sp.]
MERVETLLQKLQQQFNDKASVEQLLLTVQMLQHELSFLQAGQPISAKGAVVVSMPLQSIKIQESPKPNPAAIETKPAQEEKIVEVLQVDEAEVAAELEEIKRHASMMQQIHGHSKPQLLFEPEENDIPTLNHQVTGRGKEINETVAEEAHSINERLKEKKIEVSEKLTSLPVKDLRKAIGINDRFLYINDLFRGDEAMYERSIKTINGFSIWPEAEYWIRRELKTKLGWTEDDETVKQFDQLVKRRFS